jgi:hypothetical protein
MNSKMPQKQESYRALKITRLFVPTKITDTKSKFKQKKINFFSPLSGSLALYHKLWRKLYKQPWSCFDNNQMSACRRGRAECAKRWEMGAV